MMGLKHIFGMKSKEISNFLETNHNTVRGILKKGREKLKISIPLEYDYNLFFK
jgi:DNA-directed RNA polymerase specialized sigma24 family protein